MPKRLTQGKVLGFDFGIKCIGLAVGDIAHQTTTALTVIRATNGHPDWEKLDTLLAEWQPVALVIGIPLNMDDTEQSLTARARKFARRLQGRYSLPIFEADERLTTKAAKERAEATAAHRQTRLDSIAAQLIIETWFSEC